MMKKKYWIICFILLMNFRAFEAGKVVETAAAEVEEESGALALFEVQRSEEQKDPLIKISCKMDGLSSNSRLTINLQEKSSKAFFEETSLVFDPAEECWFGYIYLPDEYDRKCLRIRLLIEGQETEIQDLEFDFDFRKRCDESDTQMLHRFYQEKCVFCHQEQWSEGYCGDTTWIINRKTGEMTFRGAGQLKNYENRDRVPWKTYRKEIVSIRLEEGITRIGSYCFYGLCSLKAVQLPESLLSIEDYAFKNCSAIERIDFPSRVQNIGCSSFYGCKLLNSIRFPDTVKSIGAFAFSRCISLNKVFFSGAAPTIGKHAFYHVTAEAEYSGDDPDWDTIIQEEYGGTIRWNYFS